MTVNPTPAATPASGSASQDRRRFRRLIGVLIGVALVLIGAAVVYAGVGSAGESGPEAEPVPPGTVPTSIGLVPDFPLPTAQPAGGFGCLQVLGILNGMIGADAGYVASRRDAADQLRQLEPATPAQQAALDALASELDAAAQLVEDDPSAEPEALEREGAASDAFAETGVC